MESDANRIHWLLKTRKYRDDYIADQTCKRQSKIVNLISKKPTQNEHKCHEAKLASPENKYLDKIKSILFSAIVRSSISDLSGLSRLAVG